jgi:hypothetical protein
MIHSSQPHAPQQDHQPPEHLQQGLLAKWIAVSSNAVIIGLWVTSSQNTNNGGAVFQLPHPTCASPYLGRILDLNTTAGEPEQGAESSDGVYRNSSQPQY